MSGGPRLYLYRLTCGHEVTYGSPGSHPGAEVICVHHEGDDAAQTVEQHVGTWVGGEYRETPAPRMTVAEVKTHCKKGLHPWVEENIYRGAGQERCRRCRSESRARHRDRSDG